MGQEESCCLVDAVSHTCSFPVEIFDIAEEVLKKGASISEISLQHATKVWPLCIVRPQFMRPGYSFM